MKNRKIASVFFIGLLMLGGLLVYAIDGGMKDTRLTDEPSINPSSTMDDDGNIYVVWEGYGNDNGIYYKFYNATTETWSNDVLVVDGNNKKPDITIGNGIYIAWENVSDDAIKFAEIDKDGNIISPIIQLDSIPSINVSIAAIGEEIYFVWEHNGSVFYEMYNMSSATWYDEMLIENNSFMPAIMYNTLKELMEIIYTSNESGNNEIHYLPLNFGSIKTSYDSDGDGIYDSVERGWTNYSNSSYDDKDTNTTTDWQDYDSDNDGLPDGWIDGWSYDSSSGYWGINYSRIDGIKQPWEGEDLNCNGAIDAGETNPNSNDSDNDGLPDGWEAWYGLNTLDGSGNNGSNGDADGDGLTNMQEYENGTSPISNDTDNDGIPDKYEIEHGINPLNADTDGDGLLDGQENFTTDIDNDSLIPPLDNDSDNDGIMDGNEYYYNLSSRLSLTPFNDSDGDGLINMLDNDSDNDGLLDGQELTNKSKIWRPAMADSDGDGVSDYIETTGRYVPLYGVGWVKTNPDNPDTDNDGLWDGNFTWRINETTGIRERYPYGEENAGWAGANPLNADSDGDGLLDGLEVFGWDITINEYGGLSYKKHVHSDPYNDDSDGDGLNDSYEYENGLDPGSTDTDDDGLLDGNEVLTFHTDPNNPDSDGDGVYDGTEWMRGTNMSNADSDNDGLPDSEGDWVIFRTNARDINGGEIIREEFDDIGNMELQYYASSIINVTVHYVQEVNVRLQKMPPGSTLNESQYWCWNASEYKAHGGDGYTWFVKTGYNLTICPINSNLDNLEVNYSADYGGFGVFNKTGYITNGEVIPINNGSTWYGTDFKVGDPWGTFNVTRIYNITLMKHVYREKQLIEAPSPISNTDYEHFNYSRQENKIIIDHNASITKVVVYYIASPAIDYSLPANDNSWIAIDRDFYLNKDLLPLGRIDGVTLDDTQIKRTHFIGHTAEGFPVYYNDKPSAFPIKYGGYTMKAIAWKPDGSYALIAGDFPGKAFLYYKNGNMAEIPLYPYAHINAIAWDWYGKYAILVGNDGEIYKFNSSNKQITQISNPISNKSLYGVTFSFSEYAVAVGDGVILSINAENGSVANVTRNVGLGGTGYTYRDIAWRYGTQFLIITQDRAFIYDVYYSNGWFDKELHLSPLPNGLISCEWKLGFDKNLNKYTDFGIITGYRYESSTQRRWYVYIVDYDDNCNDYEGPVTPVSNDPNYKDFTFTSMTLHPILPQVLITGAGKDYGRVYTFDLRTGNINLTASLQTELYSIDFEPHGDFALIGGYDKLVQNPQLIGYIYPYATIDVPGSHNPIYGERWLYDTAQEAKYAQIGRGSILSYYNAGKETKNDLMLTDPLNPSSFNDGLLDGYRLKLGFEDSDHDGTPNFLDRDADNDNILNGEEAYPLFDFDNDSIPNALDSDSDNDGVADGQEVRVVYRSNSNGAYNNSIWMGIETNSSNSYLEEYWFDSIINAAPNASMHPVNYTLLGSPVQIHTPEGYPVYESNNGYVYIDVPGPTMARFVQTNMHIPDNSTSLNTSYAMAHEEKYNCTGMLTDDSDNDGLPDSMDPSPFNADIDGDGIKDGYERNWNISIDDDGLPAYADVDSDNDGLPDGWIDGWGYNASKAAAHDHYEGTIDGWGMWYTPDGIKQPWEGEDLNLNGLTDGSETNPENGDTDNDGFLDGEEVAIYHTDPVGGGDADNDGLSDYDEVFGLFAVDTINVVDYMNYSRDTITKFSDGWRGIAHGVTIPVKIPFNGTFYIWTTPAESTITLNGTTITAGFDTPMETTLQRGIYNVTISSSSYISRLVIAKRGCNMSNPDSDGDGIPDGAEIGSPLDSDSDNDGLLDSEEQIPYYDSLTHEYLFSYTVSSPVDKDSDLDGLSDKNDPSRLAYDFIHFNHHTYPPASIMENRTFRGWGLDGHSWIIYRWSTSDRGKDDVKVSNMSDIDKAKENILKILPKWYNIYPHSVVNLGDALSHSYNDTWEWSDFSGYPKYRIRYYYKANLYNATIYNNQSVYKYANGEIGTEEKEHFRYALFNTYVKEEKPQNLIIKYVLPIGEDEHYFIDENHYKLPAFEYRIYRDTATGWYFDKNWKYGYVDFNSYPMQSIFLMRTGYITPTEVESNSVEIAYSISIPIPSNYQGILHIYLSPSYVVKNGSCEKQIIPWDIDSIKVAGMEKVVSSYSYKIIAKLSENITAINDAIPADIQNSSIYPDGFNNIGGYNIYIYNGIPDDFHFNAAMLGGDAIAIISPLKEDVDKIVSMINFTTSWYYNVSNVFDENMTLKEYKSIVHDEVDYYTYSFVSDLGVWYMWTCEDEQHTDKNITSITKHNNSMYNYTISYINSIVDSDNHKRIFHVIKDQNNTLDGIPAFASAKYNEIKTIFETKADNAILSTDSSLVMMLAPHKKPDGSIVMESFSTISSMYGITSGTYGAFKTLNDLRKIQRITDPIKKAEKIKDFMTPEVGPLEVADFAFSALDLGLTWYNAYNANDKFITRAAGEHTAAVAIDVGISAAGIAFPPAGVVGITWTATYYGMVGGMRVLGIEESPYLEYASDPGEALVFSFVVFTGISMPAQFAQEAFQNAENEILTHYMNASQFVNAKDIYDEECGWYTIEPYYPQFYMDPR